MTIPIDNATFLARPSDIRPMPSVKQYPFRSISSMRYALGVISSIKGMRNFRKSGIDASHKYIFEYNELYLPTYVNLTFTNKISLEFK